MRNGWETFDKGEKMQLGAWRKEWIRTLIYHYWLAAVGERPELTNGFAGEAGLRCLVFLAHPSCPLWLMCGSVTPTSIPPTRESGTVTGSPWSTVFSEATVYSAPARNVWESGSYCLMFLLQFTLGKVCFHDASHSLELWPCQSLLGASAGSVPILFIVPTQLIGRRYIKR